MKRYCGCAELDPTALRQSQLTTGYKAACPDKSSSAAVIVSKIGDRHAEQGTAQIII
jgi:hypothetical protein